MPVVEFLQFTLSGIVFGMIYAAIALSLVLIWRGTRLLNFAQGGMAMLTTYVAIEVIYKTHSYWAGFVVALAAGLLLGAASALTVVLGALGGVVVSPSTFLYPNSMDAIFVLGFTAAVIGGLDSPVGAVVGGLLLGVALSYVGGYLNSDLTSLVALGILVAVLMIRPNGLFATARMRRVGRCGRHPPRPPVPSPSPRVARSRPPNSIRAPTSPSPAS